MRVIFQFSPIFSSVFLDCVSTAMRGEKKRRKAVIFLTHLVQVVYNGMITMRISFMLMAAVVLKPLAGGRSSESRRLRSELLESMSGCVNIFLDLGSNLGIHMRQIWEAENYPLSYYLPVFDRWYPLKNGRNRYPKDSEIQSSANVGNVEQLSRIENEYRTKSKATMRIEYRTSTQSRQNIG